ncbi:hypothetical protein BH24ACT26_BH24ACT26_23320 [soil metagenome]
MLTFMSWNMNQQVQAWTHLGDLAEHHHVSAALLQEAKNPKALPTGWTSNPPASEDRDDDLWRISVPRYYRAEDGELRETRRWYASAVISTAVISTNGPELRPRVPLPLHQAADGEFACSHPGQFAVSDVCVDGAPVLTLVSLYGIWDTMIDSGDKYAEATLHRALSDLTPLFQERAARLVLVAGDLNLYSYSDGSIWGNRWMSVWSRFKAYDLEICGPFRPDGEPRLDRCPCPDPECRHVNTYLYKSNTTSKPHQLDFFLATPALCKRLVEVWADPDPTWPSRSDHRPIFATFDI